MVTASQTESRVRARTRRAILDAAAGALSRDPGASLAEVADVAGVGRSTLHRYFPDRADLLDAVGTHAFEAMDAAVERARPGDGPPRPGMLRLCQELFELGDLLSLIFGPVLAGRPEWQRPSAAGRAVDALLDRGQADGTIDPSPTSAWAQDLLWCLLYAANAHVAETGVSRHRALSLALHSFDGALRPH